MKSVYELSKKELSELLIRFSKTHYGKIQFVLSYSLFVILFIVLLIALFLYFQTRSYYIIAFLFIHSLITFISFIQGSRHFYNEVRYFSYNEKSHR